MNIDSDNPHTSPHTKIYRQIVDFEKEESLLIGLIAFGLYTRSFSNWEDAFIKKRRRRPNDDEMIAYIETWTDDRQEGLKMEASSSLAAFADYVVTAEEEKSTIVRAAARYAERVTISRNIFHSVIANFIFSLVTGLIAVLLTLFGYGYLVQYLD